MRIHRISLRLLIRKYGSLSPQWPRKIMELISDGLLDKMILILIVKFPKKKKIFDAKREYITSFSTEMSMILLISKTKLPNNIIKY